MLLPQRLVSRLIQVGDVLDKSPVTTFGQHLGHHINLLDFQAFGDALGNPFLKPLLPFVFQCVFHVAPLILALQVGLLFLYGKVRKFCRLQQVAYRGFHVQLLRRLAPSDHVRQATSPQFQRSADFRAYVGELAALQKQEDGIAHQPLVALFKAQGRHLQKFWVLWPQHLLHDDQHVDWPQAVASAGLHVLDASAERVERHTFPEVALDGALHLHDEETAIGGTALQVLHDLLVLGVEPDVLRGEVVEVHDAGLTDAFQDYVEEVDEYGFMLRVEEDGLEAEVGERVYVGWCHAYMDERTGVLAPPGGEF